VKDFAPAVGPQTMILPLLNGMKHIDTLIARFGDDAVLGGATRLSTDLDSEGRVLQLSKINDLVYGERSGALTSRIQALQATLSNAGIEDVLSPDIVAFMWQKWVTLASGASITCLLRGSIGEIAAVSYGRETELSIVDECNAIASAEGHPTSEQGLRFIRDHHTRPGNPFTASMYRDLQKGAAVEVEEILGDLLARGASRNVTTPLVRAAYVQLSVYANGRTK
jgi:2-dehydropantoate 2-reductase